MSPITIDDNFPSFSDDSEVLRSRLFGDELLDAAIIGTVVNDEGNRVIVYAEDNLIYLISLRVESGEFGECPADVYGETSWSRAQDYLEYKLSDVLAYAKPFAPVIVSEALEDVSYDEFHLYLLGSTLFVGESVND